MNASEPPVELGEPRAAERTALSIPLREQLRAVLLAALCSTLFLGDGLLPSRAVLPFAPECFEPVRSEAVADGRLDPAELNRGNGTMGDKFNQSLAWDRILQCRLRAGELPRWTRDIAGGAPMVPQMAQVYQPWNLLLLAIDSTDVYGYWVLGHLVVIGWLAH